MSGLPSALVFHWVIRFVEPGLCEMQECEYVDCIEFIVGFLVIKWLSAEQSYVETNGKGFAI
jgi:hypothetical protein